MWYSKLWKNTNVVCMCFMLLLSVTLSTEFSRYLAILCIVGTVYRLYWMQISSINVWQLEVDLRNNLRATNRFSILHNLTTFFHKPEFLRQFLEFCLNPPYTFLWPAYNEHPRFLTTFLALKERVIIRRPIPMPIDLSVYWSSSVWAKAIILKNFTSEKQQTNERDRFQKT